MKRKQKLFYSAVVITFLLLILFIFNISSNCILPCRVLFAFFIHLLSLHFIEFFILFFDTHFSVHLIFFAGCCEESFDTVRLFFSSCVSCSWILFTLLSCRLLFHLYSLISLLCYLFVSGMLISCVLLCITYNYSCAQYYCTVLYSALLKYTPLYFHNMRESADEYRSMRVT